MKINKFIRKNRAYFIAIGVVLVIFLIWNYWKKSQTTNQTPSTDRTGTKYRIGQQRYFDPSRVYKMLMLTDTDIFSNRCTWMKAEEIDTVQLVLPLSETFKGANNYDFAPYIEYANIAAEKGLNLVIKPNVEVAGKILGSVFTQSDMMQDRNGNRLSGGTYQLSFASTKWNEIYSWATALEREFRPFHDAGYVIANFPACHSTQEFVYNYYFRGDFSEIETAKSGSLNQMQNLEYSRYQTTQLVEKFHTLCNIFQGWRMGYDAGSFFIGDHRYVGSFDFERIANHVGCKFIKNNPRIYDSAEFNAALCYDWKVRKNGFYCAEWTNADGANADTLADRHGTTINQGANLLSFSFHAPDQNGGGQGWEMYKQTRNRLKDRGDWSKSVTTPARTGLLSYSLADIYNQNGYENGLLASFNALKNSNGGVLPNVRCTG